MPAVAGSFYPAVAAKWQREIGAFLGTGTGAAGPVPKALITPHGGHIYSGPLAIAAASYSGDGDDPLG